MPGMNFCLFIIFRFTNKFIKITCYIKGIFQYENIYVNMIVVVLNRFLAFFVQRHQFRTYQIDLVGMLRLVTYARIHSAT